MSIIALQYRQLRLYRASILLEPSEHHHHHFPMYLHIANTIASLDCAKLAKVESWEREREFDGEIEKSRLDHFDSVLRERERESRWEEHWWSLIYFHCSTPSNCTSTRAFQQLEHYSFSVGSTLRCGCEDTLMWWQSSKQSRVKLRVAIAREVLLSNDSMKMSITSPSFSPITSCRNLAEASAGGRRTSCQKS